DPRQIAARGSVKTTLRPGSNRRAGGEPAGPRGEAARKVPGLLEEHHVENVNADAMAFAEATGQARYTGSAVLWQGETSIRGDAIAIDQTNGNLTATGSARSNIALASGVSAGRAHEIVYDDARHTVSYVALVPPPAAPAPARGA